uniref:MIF4G domain-containing protein n=1 Tax=viral metagenome TaxID=1070528 RepID=A0A6C0F2Y1_9ZZZZ
MAITATMAKRYTLEDFTNISFAGFNFTIPEETIDAISALAIEVGSPTYIKTPNFQKRERPPVSNSFAEPGSINRDSHRKKRGNKAMEVSSEDWEAIRTFSATKIEKKVGVDGVIDKVRLHLNKLTDKTYEDMKNNIAEILKETTDEEIEKVGTAIFDIACNNRFYSKLYADLYADLIDRFTIMQEIFEKNFSEFLRLFDTIQYITPEENYTKFCDINKENEKRRSISLFFVNLCISGIVRKERIVSLSCNLLRQVVTMISQDDKKNEVDEITENVILLFNKTFIESIDQTLADYMIGELTIIDTIHMLAKSKVKSYPSLTNKTIFKYMDLIEM